MSSSKISSQNHEPRTSDLNVDEVHVVSSDVNNGPEEDLIGDLSVEPDILIRRERPGESRSNDTNDVAQHWNQDETTVEGEDETSTTRAPNGPFQRVQAGKPDVRCLELCLLATGAVAKPACRRTHL